MARARQDLRSPVDLFVCGTMLYPHSCGHFLCGSSVLPTGSIDHMSIPGHIPNYKCLYPITKSSLFYFGLNLSIIWGPLPQNSEINVYFSCRAMLIVSGKSFQFMVLDSRPETRCNKATEASGLKDQHPILVEANTQLQESRWFPQKQPGHQIRHYCLFRLLPTKWVGRNREPTSNQ